MTVWSQPEQRNPGPTSGQLPDKHQLWHLPGEGASVCPPGRLLSPGCSGWRVGLCTGEGQCPQGHLWISCPLCGPRLFRSLGQVTRLLALKGCGGCGGGSWRGLQHLHLPRGPGARSLRRAVRRLLTQLAVIWQSHCLVLTQLSGNMPPPNL